MRTQWRSRSVCSACTPVARRQLHAVAVSSRYEAAVLQSIAALGSGALQRITGETGPAAVARQLVAELTQPCTRIARVEFPGLLTARVYPADFPRLPAGGQQIVLGRYLPEAGKTQCEVVVTCERGGERFTLRAPVSLTEAGEGNSFIPRLWARQHLEALLGQGSSAAVQAEIVALSEEYHLLTPYTSLLVLETDADRERFKVQRRFQMRDGERFFATGREQVHYELLQQQMRQAGDWRIRLRQAVLRELAGLGRQAELERFVAFATRYSQLHATADTGLSPMLGGLQYWGGIGGMGGMGGMGGGMGGHGRSYGRDRQPLDGFLWVPRPTKRLV